MADSYVHLIQDDLISLGALLLPSFQFADHHEVIAQRLMDVEEGKIKRLIINLPPRHGKSLVASQLFPAWYLGRNPDKRIICCSYGQVLATQFGRQVKNWIDSPEYQSVFPTRPAPDSKASNRFNTNVGNGGYVSAGITGAITGMGADVFLIDDPVKSRQEADSITYQDRVWEWFHGTARTRLEANGAIILIMTRWGTNDLTQKLLDESSSEEWEVVTMPAISRNGNALWPQVFDIESLKKTKAEIGSREFDSQYQQCPTEDSSIIFRSAWIQRYPWRPEEVMFDFMAFYPGSVRAVQQPKVIHSWDLSFGGSRPDNSFCVGQVWLKPDGVDGYYLIHQVRRQMGFTECKEAIIQLRQDFPSDTILIENRANGAAVIDALRNQVRTAIIPIEPMASKEDRAYQTTAMFEREVVFFPNDQHAPWLRPLLREMNYFPLGSSDDCIDAMT